MRREKAVVINDLHIPFQDHVTVELVERFLKDFKPDVLFLNGDIADFWDVSTFMKDPRDGIGLSDELREVRTQLSTFVGLAKRVIYLEGNHSFRLRKYIVRNAKELIGLTGLSIEEQLGLTGLGIGYVRSIGRESTYLYGDVLIGHFNKVNKHSAYTAKNLLESKGISLIQGHTHRAGMHVKTTFDRTLVAIENGCLCDLRPNYVATPDWQQALTVIYKDNQGHCEMHLILIDNHKFTFNKKTYKEKK